MLEFLWDPTAREIECVIVRVALYGEGVMLWGSVLALIIIVRMLVTVTIPPMAMLSRIWLRRSRMLWRTMLALWRYVVSWGFIHVAYV